MGRVFYDIAFKGGEYQDREGKTKHRYKNQGKLVVEDDGRMWGVLEFLGLEQTFSVFPQQDRDDRGGQRGGNGGGSRGDDRRDNGGSRGTPRAGETSGRRTDLDDDIPF